MGHFDEQKQERIQKLLAYIKSVSATGYGIGIERLQSWGSINFGVTPAKISEYVKSLVSAGLIKDTDKGFIYNKNS